MEEESHDSLDVMHHAAREEHAKNILGKASNTVVYFINQCMIKAFHGVSRDLSLEVFRENVDPFAREGFL